MPDKKKFFGDQQVLRTRREINGRELPAHQILVKLRPLGGAPKWRLMLLEAYKSGLTFRYLSEKQPT